MKNRFCFAAAFAASLLLTIEAMSTDTVNKVQPAAPSTTGNDRLSTTVRTNKLSFNPDGNVSSVGFVYFGNYDITSGQTLKSVTTSKNNVDVRAGRSKSSGVADWFNNGLTADNVISTAETGDLPGELNFAIRGILNVYLKDSTVVNLPVCIGEGCLNNDWYIGCSVLSIPSDYFVSSVGPAPIWASGTGGHAAGECTSTYPNLQPDGNLVIYDHPNPAIWASNTGITPSNPTGHPNAKLIMQLDGNLVIYDHSQLWVDSSIIADTYVFDSQAGCLEFYNKNQYVSCLPLIPPHGTPPYRLAMQLDGNIVMCDYENVPQWATNTGGHIPNGLAASLGFNENGNPVVNFWDTPIWASNTGGHSGATCQFQDDGNLVICDNGTPIWESGTGGRAAGECTCTYPNLQSDGNLVIYDYKNPRPTPIWATNTGATPTNPAGHPNAQLVMQGDGNLVINDYDNNGKLIGPIWASGTGGGWCAGATCVFQSDGNLVISYENNTPIYIHGPFVPADFYVSTTSSSSN